MAQNSPPDEIVGRDSVRSGSVARECRDSACCSISLSGQSSLTCPYVGFCGLHSENPPRGMWPRNFRICSGRSIAMQSINFLAVHKNTLLNNPSRISMFCTGIPQAQNTHRCAPRGSGCAFVRSQDAYFCLLEPAPRSRRK